MSDLAGTASTGPEDTAVAVQFGGQTPLLDPPPMQPVSNTPVHPSEYRDGVLEDPENGQDVGLEPSETTRSVEGQNFSPDLSGPTNPLAADTAATAAIAQPEPLPDPSPELLDGFRDDAGQSWAASVGLTFEEPPAGQGRGRGSGVVGRPRHIGWDQRLMPLIATPGRWVKISFPGKIRRAEYSVTQIRKAVRTEILPGLESGKWEITVRTDKLTDSSYLYVRYILNEGAVVPALDAPNPYEDQPEATVWSDDMGDDAVLDGADVLE